MNHSDDPTDENSFLKCPLEYVNIPASWSYIPGGPFSDCTIKEIEIPSSIKSIDRNAFLNCTGLVSVIYGGTEKQWKALVDGCCGKGKGNDILKSPDLVVTYKHVHTGGTATCTKKAVCEDCGEEYGEFENHDFSKCVSNGDGTHKVVCKDCDAVQLDHDNFKV